MSEVYHTSQPVPSASGIYKLVYAHSDKIYIGSASNLHVRYNRHFNMLRKGTHHNQKLQHAWDKHGPGTFVFEIIEFVLPPFLLEREQYWIDKLNPWFNIAPVAGSLLGIKRTPEHTEKIRQSLIGKPSPNRGKPRPIEVIEKVKATKQAKSIPTSERQRPCQGCGKPFFNRKHPEQQFCSRRCSNQRQVNQIQRTCTICGTIFSRQAAKISDYCSAECSYQSKCKDITEAFWSKVDKTSDCWIWTKAKDKHGYGLFTQGKGGHTIGAHRFSFELSYGPIPDNMFVRHRCNNPSCVRPDHLFLATQTR